jgi:surface antigen/peptidoglycan hydrolase CwlO-like protein
MISLTHKVKQKMKKTKKIQLKSLFKSRFAVFAVLTMFVFGVVLTPAVVRAVSNITGQINELNQDNSELSQQKQVLSVEANSLQDAIGILQTQIDGLQAQINDSNAQIDLTVQQIADAEAELAKQKDLLAENIKEMYLEGQITTLEMLATSKDLSEFVDKQQYRDTIQSKIKDTLDKVTALKLELKGQKDRLEAQKTDQVARQTELDSQRAEQAHLLGLNQSQRNELDSQIKANNAQIAELRRQQAIENARLFGTTPGSGAACGGGYPGSANGPWGKWGCNYALDNNIDNWGMYNRECVSYAAFKVAASGRYMPYWGGRGNANKWDDNARAAGIPVDNSPRAGDVAISNAGYYGHAMYVEHVYDDGRILISQYNGDWTGKYSEAVINRGSLVFIHFP